MERQSGPRTSRGRSFPLRPGEKRVSVDGTAHPCHQRKKHRSLTAITDHGAVRLTVRVRARPRTSSFCDEKPSARRGPTPWARRRS